MENGEWEMESVNSRIAEKWILVKNVCADKLEGVFQFTPVKESESDCTAHSRSEINRRN